MSILRWQPKNIQELWVSFCHCGIALIHFDTLQASRQKGSLQKQKRLMLENRRVLQCFTGHLLLLGSPWTQFCSASVEEQWEAGQGRTLTFFELRTSYAIMCHFLVSEIANRFGLFFIQEPISEELHCGLDRTHPRSNMHVIEAKQTNVIICQLTMSIYVNLLQQWIWICWISVYHRIDYQNGIWHIKNHQNICSIQQLFFRGLRLKFQDVSRKTMFRYSESFEFQLRCPRRSASTSRCICSSFACNLGTELGLGHWK